MEGQDSLILNIKSLRKCFLQIPLNQPITVSVFFHRFEFIASCMFLFAISKIVLLIRSNSIVHEFISLTIALLLKFSLGSFRVLKVLLSGFISNRFTNTFFSKIRFPWILSCFSMLLLAFLYFEVMALVIIWSYFTFVN